MNSRDIQSQLENFQPSASVDNTTNLVNKTFLFNIGKMEIAPTYWQAGLIIFLLFVLILTLARLRHMYVGWSMKGFFPILSLGFLLALVFEGFMILGGKTLLTEILGWKNAPKPISTALDEGRNRLINVLGVNEEIEYAEKKLDYQDILTAYEKLSDEDKEKVNKNICTP